MNMKRTVNLAIGVSLLLLVLAAPRPTQADSASIVLASASNGVFDYVLNAPSTGTTFLNGQGVTFTGLSGVISASVICNLSMCFTVTSPASSSVTFEQTRFPGFCTYFGPNQGFVLDSPVNTLGTVDWSMQISVGNGVEALTGMVPGPAGPSAVSEPSSLAFLGSALTGLLAVKRRLKG